MEHVLNKLYTILIKAFCFGSICVLGYLAFQAAKQTHYYPYLFWEKVFEIPDSPVRNCILAGVILTGLFLLQKVLLQGKREQRQKTIKWLTAAALVFIGGGLLFWVTICHSMPVADQLQVFYAAREFHAGNFNQMKSYMYMYPQQYGLTFFYEILLRIWDSYRFLQYLNIIFILIIIKFCCLLADLLFENKRVVLYCLLGCILHFPMLLYVNFVYGELGSTAMNLITLWCVLKWLKSEKIKYIVTALISSAIALLIRKNSLIILLAVFVVFMLHGIFKKNWRALLLAALILVVPLGSIKAVQLSYEIRSGVKIEEGIPAILWIAMGMQDSADGKGIYNAYNNSVFWNKANGDSKIAAQIGKDYIKTRMKEFFEDPSMTRDFYRSKLLEQWNEVSFGSLIMTSHFDKEPEGIVKKIYSEDSQMPILKVMNIYLFILYLGAFACAIRMLFQKNDKIQNYIGLIAVIGGVLFSLLWESKSRYIITYVIILVPYMAYGLHTMQEVFGRILSKGSGFLKNRLLQKFTLK